MGAKKPRQIVVLGIANSDEVMSVGPDALEGAMRALERIALHNGAQSGNMRRVGATVLAVRVDEMSGDEYLHAVRGMAAATHNLTLSEPQFIHVRVRVGAMNESASRSIVNDATMELLALMEHNDYSVAFLTGGDLSSWQQHDISDIKLLSYAQLKYMDPFTGLLREERFFELLDYALNQRESYDNMSVLYVDLDDFKSYNRAYGHEEGDKLLVFVAQQLRDAFPADVVAYLSIDHFAIFTSAPDVIDRCVTVHKAIKAYSKTFSPELKCGIFKDMDAVDSAYEALDCAKMACKTVKGHYDACCGFFTRKAKENVTRQLYVARYAERAVANH